MEQPKSTQLLLRQSAPTNPYAFSEERKEAPREEASSYYTQCFRLLFPAYTDLVLWYARQESNAAITTQNRFELGSDVMVE